MAYSFRGTASLGLSGKGLRNGSVILDIGESFTKAGFSGEAQPRQLFRTRLEQGGKLLSPHTVIPQDEWVVILKPYFKQIFLNHLHINALDRRVLICENIYWPLAFKAGLVTALFELRVPAVAFLPSQVLPLYCTGEDTGVVVDVGFAETRVQPIQQGFPLTGSLKTCPLGVQHVSTNFRELAKDVLDPISASAQEIDDMVLRTAVVQSKASPTPLGDVQYILGADNLTIPGASRAATNVLFGDNEQGYNVAHTVLDALLRTATDSRGLLIKNFVLAGGPSVLPGFGARFTEELNAALELSRYSKLSGLAGKFSVAKTVFVPTILTWIGASIAGSLDLAEEDFLDRDLFLEGGQQIPDWSYENEEEEEEESDEEESDEDEGDEGDEGESDEEEFTIF